MTAPAPRSAAGGAARNRIERLRQVNPAAVQLAVLAATAVRIEPALLRRLRLLVPGADVGAESDLWSSGLLSSASPLAVSLEPACAHLLREELGGRDFAPLRDRAIEVIEAHHAELHWSLRLEEAINRLMLGPSPDLDQAERLLYAAIGRLRDGGADGTDPVRVARWLLAALGRIPARLRSTRAWQVASVGAGVRLDGRYAGPPGESAGVDMWMPWLLELAGIRDRHVPIRFDQGVLVVNGTGPDCVEIRVPGTTPMVLNLTWHDGRVHHRQVEFRAGETHQIPVGAEQVELRDLTGAGYTVARRVRGPQSLRPPEGLDFSGRRASLRPCLGRADELRTVVRAVSDDRAPVVTIAGAAGAGKSVLLGAALDELEAQGFAVAEHFYETEPRWDASQTVATSLMAQIRAAVTAPQAPPTWEGRRRALIITNGRYQDRRLAELRPVDRDAVLLIDVLNDRERCGFEVEVLADADRRTTADRLSAFFRDADREDLLLVYVATHAITDRSELTFATEETDAGRPGATGLSSSALTRPLADTRARTVVVLDLCQIGGEAGRRDPMAPLRDHLRGFSAGTVISAPSSFEYRIDDRFDIHRVGLADPVPLTRVVAEGLRTGLADLDGDGTITAEELGRFVRDRTASGAGTLVMGQTSGRYGREPVLARWPVARRPLPLRLGADGRIPSNFLEKAAADARSRPGGSLPGIVIALDGLPEPVERFTRAMLPLSSPLPDGVHVIATVRADDEDRLGRSLFADAFRLPMTSRSSRVCHALVDYHAVDLARAFGHPDAGAGLIREAEEMPGRLAALIEWATSRPAGTARMDDIPPLAAMATDEFWTAVSPKLLDLLLLVVTARTGFTVAALIAAAGSPRGGILSQLAQLTKRGLVSLTGEPTDLDTFVTVSTPEVVAATGRFPERTAQAHRRHAAAFPFDEPRSALPYQIETVARHAARGGDDALIGRVVSSGGFLDVRLRRDGIDALLDDLAALASADRDGRHRRTANRIRQALSGLVGVLREAPEFFVDLLRGRLTADGAGVTAAEVFAGWTGPALAVRGLSAVGGPGFRTLDASPVRAATTRHDEMITISSSTVHWSRGVVAVEHHVAPTARILGAVAVARQVAIATASSLTIVHTASGKKPRMVDLGPATVTALLGGASLHVGLADGRVLEFPAVARSSLPARRLVGHIGPVTALTASSDALISAGADGTVRVWPRETESAPLYTYRAHGAAVTALVEARQGWVLSGDADGQLRLWDERGGAERIVPTAHEGPITRLLPMPGGMVSADGNGVVQAWDWDGGLTVRPGRRWRVPGSEAVTGLAHTGGVLAVVTAAGTIHWLTADAHAALRTVEAGDEVHEIAFTADGSLLVALSGGLVSYAPVPPSAEPGGVLYRSALAVDRAGSMVLAGMPTGVATLMAGTVVGLDASGDPAVRAAWTADGLPLTVRGSGRAHVSAAVDPDDRFVLVASGRRTSWLVRDDGEIREVTRQGSRVRWRARHHSEVTALAVSDTPRRVLAIGHADGIVRLSHFDGRTLAEIPTDDGPVLGLAAAADLILGLSANGTLFQLGTDGLPGVATLARHEGAVQIAVTGRGVVSCSTDGTLRLWTIETGELIGIVAGRLPFDAVAASENGEIVARDAMDRIWFLHTGAGTARPGAAASLRTRRT